MTGLDQHCFCMSTDVREWMPGKRGLSVSLSVSPAGLAAGFSLPCVNPFTCSFGCCCSFCFCFLPGGIAFASGPTPVVLFCVYV